MKVPKSYCARDICALFSMRYQLVVFEVVEVNSPVLKNGYLKILFVDINEGNKILISLVDD